MTVTRKLPIPQWGVAIPEGYEFDVWIARLRTYDEIHYWRSHPARHEALANTIGFASI